MRDCGTSKTIVLDSSGKIVASRYQYDKDYHVKGGLDQNEMAWVRIALMELL